MEPSEPAGRERSMPNRDHGGTRQSELSTTTLLLKAALESWWFVPLLLSVVAIGYMQWNRPRRPVANGTQRSSNSFTSEHHTPEIRAQLRRSAQLGELLQGSASGVDASLITTQLDDWTIRDAELRSF
jgi:hypothetical protein